MYMRQVALHRFGMGGIPAGSPLWTLAPAGAVTLTITLTTDDTLPIYVNWGDNTAEMVDHNTATSHSYAGAGTYVLGLLTPERLVTFQNSDDTIAFNGTVNTSSFPYLTSLKIRKAGITGISLSSSTLLETVELNNNALTTVDLVTIPLFTTNIISLRLDSNSLSAAAIDTVITDLDYGANVSGTLNYGSQSGGTDAWSSRSPGAQTAQQALVSKGWSVTPAEPLVTRLLMHFNTGVLEKEEITGLSFTNQDIVEDTGVFGTCAKAIMDSGVYPKLNKNYDADIKAKLQYDYRTSWVFDFWVKFNAVQNYSFVLNWTGDNNLDIQARYNNPDQVAVIFRQKNNIIALAYRSGLNLDEFHHCFIQYDGSKVRGGIAGKVVLYDNPSATLYDYSSNTGNFIQVCYSNLATNGLIFYLDEFCFREGAPYTGAVNDDYTIPSSPFST